jgi:hypothetical protein
MQEYTTIRSRRRHGQHSIRNPVGFLLQRVMMRTRRQLALQHCFFPVALRAFSTCDHVIAAGALTLQPTHSHGRKDLRRLKRRLLLGYGHGPIHIFTCPSRLSHFARSGKNTIGLSRCRGRINLQTVSARYQARQVDGMLCPYCKICGLNRGSRASCVRNITIINPSIKAQVVLRAVRSSAALTRRPLIRIRNLFLPARTDLD